MKIQVSADDSAFFTVLTGVLLPITNTASINHPNNARLSASVPHT